MVGKFEQSLQSVYLKKKLNQSRFPGTRPAETGSDPSSETLASSLFQRAREDLVSDGLLWPVNHQRRLK